MASCFRDVSKIHDGIGDKIGVFFQWMSGFLCGFGVGFYYGWKLTLVILAVSPLLAGSAVVFSQVGEVLELCLLCEYLCHRWVRC